ncbi:MAG: preprotein translocase subunit SecF [Parcubacteria group bacterium Gr01-1014_30]|nr:MAG: preprotein translocase subunit SecF [Parcubacteria group bacterium Gr01-1014_30]
MEAEFELRPENMVISEKLKNLNLGEITIQPTGEQGVILRIKDIDEPLHQEILKNLREISGLKEVRFENTGPTVGKELRQKTIVLIIISLFSLLIYMAFSFRKVKYPLSGWQFGIVAIVVLFFDVLVPIGIFAFLGKFYNTQFNIPITTALLTILGYTINDKVIVFDRVRENILRMRGADFNAVVNQSLNEVLLRSLSTGTCTLLVLFFIFLLGGETLRYFALTLILGIVAGTYSSIFLGGPLLVTWEKWRRK